MKPEIPEMNERPSGPDFMWVAFIGCVSFAAHNEECLDAFLKEHPGEAISMPRTPMDKMIDDATGASRVRFARFCDWVAKNLCGLEGEEE